MWNKPWGYKEGMLIGGGLFATGLLLQATAGKIEWDWIAFPVNVGILLCMLAGLAAMHLLRRKVYLFSWLSHHTAAVSSLCWVTGITVCMGCIRQIPSHHTLSGIEGVFSFSQMLSFWPFVLLYTWLTVALGMTILRVCIPFRLRKLPFLLNHAGLFIALLTATLGNADMQRLRMTTTLGKAEWRAQDDITQAIVELPLAIELNRFTIDEYPPKLMLIDNQTGEALPPRKPEHLLLEEGFHQGRLSDWDITVTQALPEAASVATEDTLRFTAFYSMGSTYAVYLKACHRQTKEVKEGWVSCGSFMFPYKALRLSQQISLVMPDREPRCFTSEVMIYTESGKQESATIEVNRPYEIEGWKIYQLSYDESKGKWSDISVFELVRDPWLPYVYAGIGMMILGAIGLFVQSPSKERKEANR